MGCHTAQSAAPHDVTLAVNRAGGDEAVQTEHTVECGTREQGQKRVICLT